MGIENFCTELGKKHKVIRNKIPKVGVYLFCGVCKCNFPYKGNDVDFISRKEYISKQEKKRVKKLLSVIKRYGTLYKYTGADFNGKNYYEAINLDEIVVPMINEIWNKKE